ncbi:MAG: hypothetical protein IPJ14_08540 [Kineosporiaceae bacterium]|nr:hypothetical protein [Kineosporiaceae bacterium]MBK7622701.1 hypothetical protein [Kineosporiaceae bacterium]MBK8078679.1 hypothetical protein [Kineosporiaceae bacterium]
MVRRFRRTLAERPHYVTALIVLVLLGAGLIVLAVLLPAGAMRDLLINLGATVVGVVLTAVVLEPLIEIARRPEERILTAFPHREFISGVAGARHTVKIMGAWPYVMDQPWRQPFLDAARSALRAGASVRILTMDPMSHAAEQRQDDLGTSVDVAALIADTLVELESFRDSLDSAAAQRFSVRIYSLLPPARLYLTDQRALCSFLSQGTNLGTDVRHYDTSIMSGLARFVDEQFDVIWGHRTTRALDSYWHLPLTTSSDGRRYDVQYVELDEVIYVASRRLIDVLFRRRLQDEQVSVPVNGSVAVFTLEASLDSSDEVSGIRTALDRKYGSRSELRQGLGAVVKLIPLPTPD